MPPPPDEPEYDEEEEDILGNLLAGSIAGYKSRPPLKKANVTPTRISTQHMMAAREADPLSSMKKRKTFSPAEYDTAVKRR